MGVFTLAGVAFDAGLGAILAFPAVVIAEYTGAGWIRVVHPPELICIHMIFLKRIGFVFHL
jgi:hypothetical protein